MTTLDVESLFPNKELTPFPRDRNPNAMEINRIKKELLANAGAVPTSLGGGIYGHMGMILTNAEYIALPGAAQWVQPPQPVLNIPAGATYQQIAHAQATFDVDHKTFELTRAVNIALKALMIKAVPSYLWTTLHHATYGMALVTPAQMLAHLVNDWGTVSEDDLAQNVEDAQKAWDPNEPTDLVFKRIDDAAAFAAFGQDNISEAAKMRYASKAFERSGVMEEVIKDWRKQNAAQKTWALMPAFFRRGNKERLRTVTATQAGYNTANAAQPPSTTATTQDNQYYCWTHGLGRNPNHTSQTCTNPAEGHQTAATVNNMMGGNNTIRRNRNERAVYRRPERRTNSESGN